MGRSVNSVNDAIRPHVSALEPSTITSCSDRHRPSHRSVAHERAVGAGRRPADTSSLIGNTHPRQIASARSGAGHTLVLAPTPAHPPTLERDLTLVVTSLSIARRRTWPTSSFVSAGRPDKERAAAAKERTRADVQTPASTPAPGSRGR